MPELTNECELYAAQLCGEIAQRIHNRLDSPAMEMVTRRWTDGEIDMTTAVLEVIGPEVVEGITALLASAAVVKEVRQARALRLRLYQTTPHDVGIPVQDPTE